jgi:hypothetical protein
MKISGKTIDTILEILLVREFISVEDLEKKVKLNDISNYLELMRGAGFIEFNDQYVRITKQALEILAAELFP